MKFVTIFLVSLCFTSIRWNTDFDKAKQQAFRENKFILINFSGSDWCGPCIEMKKEIFESGAFINFASDHLILVNADFPRLKKNKIEDGQTAKNNALAAVYDPDGKFPLTVLVNARGKVLQEWDGLPRATPEEFTEQIKTVPDAGN